MAKSINLGTIHNDVRKLSIEELNDLAYYVKEALNHKKVVLDKKELLKLKTELIQIQSEKFIGTISAEITCKVQVYPGLKDKKIRVISLEAYSEFQKMERRFYKNKDVIAFLDKMQKKYDEWYTRFSKLARKSKLSNQDLYHEMCLVK